MRSATVVRVNQTRAPYTHIQLSISHFRECAPTHTHGIIILQMHRNDDEVRSRFYHHIDVWPSGDFRTDIHRTRI